VSARIVDIAGVPIAFDVSDGERAAVLESALAGWPDAAGPAVATLVLDAVPAARPDDPSHSELYGFEFWARPGGCAVASRTLVVEVDRAEARLHLPDLAEAPLLEGCVHLAVAWLIAPHDRFMVHGAAIERAGAAFLLLGNSGAGKSTLIAAAIESGWQALGDDLTIVERIDATSAQLHGVHKMPAIPAEIGGPILDHAVTDADHRERVGLPRELLAGGAHPARGVVRITHSAAPEGSLRRVPAHEALPLFVQSFTGSIDPELRATFFPTAAALVRRASWELGHAPDPATRRERAAAHLDEMTRASS
jgi:hypothetical protein